MVPILLLTATGRSSLHLISLLLSSPDCPIIRVLIHSETDVHAPLPPQLRSAPHSIVKVDSLHGQAFKSAFRGVTTVFHNGSSIHSQEWYLAIAIIDMAREAGVKHFILCSVFHSIRTKLHVHKIKLSIEEYLVESRLDYTILQPTLFMQNVALSRAVQTGVISLGFSSSIVTGFIDLQDLAIVTRNIILSPALHFLAVYELVGQNASYEDVARIVAGVCRRDVQCNVLSRKEFIDMMIATGELRSEYAEDAIERLMTYYDRWRVRPSSIKYFHSRCMTVRGLAGNANVLRWLLGREPTTWEDYIRREMTRI